MCPSLQVHMGQPACGSLPSLPPQGELGPKKEMHSLWKLGQESFLGQDSTDSCLVLPWEWRVGDRQIGHIRSHPSQRSWLGPHVSYMLRSLTHPSHLHVTKANEVHLLFLVHRWGCQRL